MIVDSPRVLYVTGGDEEILELLKATSKVTYDYTDVDRATGDEEVYEPSDDIGFVASKKVSIGFGNDKKYSLVTKAVNDTVEYVLCKEPIDYYPLMYKDSSMVRYVDIVVNKVATVSNSRELLDNLSTIATIAGQHEDKVVAYRVIDKVFTGKCYTVVSYVFRNSKFVNGVTVWAADSRVESIDRLLAVELLDLVDGVI